MKKILLSVLMATFISACSEESDNNTYDNTAYEEPQFLVLTADEALTAVKSRYSEDYAKSADIEVTEIQDLNNTIRSYEVLLLDKDHDVSRCLMVAHNITKQISFCNDSSHTLLKNYDKYWQPVIDKHNIMVIEKKLVGTEHYVVQVIKTDKPLDKALNDTDDQSDIFNIHLGGNAYPLAGYYVLSPMPYFKFNNFQDLLQKPTHNTSVDD